MSKQKQSNDTYPALNTKVHFVAAAVYARDINKKDRLVTFSSSHRCQYAKVDDGYLLIEQEWHVKSDH